MATIIGALNLTATYESINVELLFTGDAGDTNSATLEYKASDSETWLDWLAPERVDDGTLSGLYGKILFLASGTAYDVRVTVADADGVSGTNPISDSVTTRVDDIPDGATLAAAVNRWVDARDGSDANDGTSLEDAWATLQKAVTELNAASSALTVGVVADDDTDPLYYARAATVLVGNGHAHRIVAITRAGAHSPAVNDSRVHQSIRPIVFDRFIAPTGAADAQAYANGGWVAHETYTDVYSLDVGYSSVMHLGFASTKEAEPARVGHWNRSGTTLQTLDNWLAMMTTNLTYQAGYWQAAGGTTLYLKLPGDVDPNDYYVWFSRLVWNDNNANTGLTLNGPDLLVNGLELRCLSNGVRITTGGDRAVVDHCSTHLCGTGVLPNANTALAEIEDPTIQYCLFRDTNTWDETPTRHTTIPWRFVKQFLVLSDGSYYTSNRVGSTAEANGVLLRQSVQRTVVRYCTFDGPFNGVGTSTSPEDRYDGYGTDVHDCLFEHIPDNPLEPEIWGVNWGCWDIVVRGASTVLSSDLAGGPIYLVGFTVWNCNTAGILDDGHPTTPNPGTTGGVFKFGGNAAPGPHLHVYHWTCHNDVGTVKIWADAVSGGPEERWHILNSIFRGTSRVLDMPARAFELIAEEDYNLFGASPDGLDYDGRRFNSSSTTGANSLDEYRRWNSVTGSGAGAILRGAHTNVIDGVEYNLVGGGQALIDAQLTDPANGDLSLIADAGAIDAGGLIAGFHVLYPGSGPVRPNHYTGDAPNIGSDQRITAVSVDPPAAPTDLTATANGEDTIDLAWTDNADDETSYRVERSLNGTTNWQVIDTLAADSTSYSDTGLPGAATRDYRVAAVNAGGAVHSNVDSATTDASATVPAAPSNLVATALTSSLIRLTWTDNASNEITFRVERSADGSTGWATRADDLPSDSGTYDDTGITAEATWFYHVVAVNPQGDSDPSNVDSATTPAFSGHAFEPRAVVPRAVQPRAVLVRATQ